MKRVRFENQPAKGQAAGAAATASADPAVGEWEVPESEVSMVVSSAVASTGGDTHQPPQQVTSQPTTTTAHQPVTEPSMRTQELNPEGEATSRCLEVKPVDVKPYIVPCTT